MKTVSTNPYGIGRWVRRIARFAIHGPNDNEDIKRRSNIRMRVGRCTRLDREELPDGVKEIHPLYNYASNE